MPFDAREALAQVPNPAAHQAAVRLELGFAGPPEPDAAFLPLEVSPAAYQAGREVLVLRELDLKLALERRGALREDVEDEAVSIEHARLERGLEIALLSRAKRLVDEDQLRARFLRARRNFLDLTAADEEARVRALAPRLDLCNDVRSGRLGERAKLLGLVVVTGSVQPDMQQQRTFAAAGAIKQPALPAPWPGG